MAEILAPLADGANIDARSSKDTVAIARLRCWASACRRARGPATLQPRAEEAPVPNVVKDAQATRAEVGVCAEDATLHVELHDDGIGPADPRVHGRMGMSDRVPALRDRLEVESPLGAGTAMAATLPLSPTEER